MIRFFIPALLIYFSSIGHDPCGADKLYWWHFSSRDRSKAIHFYDSMVHRYPCSDWQLTYTTVIGYPNDWYNGYSVQHHISPLANDVHKDKLIKIFHHK